MNWMLLIYNGVIHNDLLCGIILSNNVKFIINHQSVFLFVFGDELKVYTNIVEFIDYIFSKSHDCPCKKKKKKKN